MINTICIFLSFDLNNRLNILLTKIVKDTKMDNNNNNNNKKKENESSKSLLQTIIFMIKFIERCDIPELYSKLLECSSKIAQCSPQSIINLDNDNMNINLDIIKSKQSDNNNNNDKNNETLINDNSKNIIH